MKLLAKSVINIVEDLLIQVILFSGRLGDLLIAPVRIFFLRVLAIKIGASSQVSPGFTIFRKDKLRAAINCRFVYDFRVLNFEQLVIENSLLAYRNIRRICINHLLTKLREDYPGPVTVRDNVSLGVDVTIVGPCEIGDGVVIGSKSFVTGYLKLGWVYVGGPARPIRPVLDHPSAVEVCRN